MIIEMKNMLKLRMLWLRLFGRKAPKDFLPKCTTEFHRDGNGKLYAITQMFDHGYNVCLYVSTNSISVTKGYSRIYYVNRATLKDWAEAVWRAAQLADSNNRKNEEGK